jgi:hypothetical protein
MLDKSIALSQSSSPAQRNLSTVTYARVRLGNRFSIPRRAGAAAIGKWREPRVLPYPARYP